MKLTELSTKLWAHIHEKKLEVVQKPKAETNGKNGKNSKKTVTVKSIPEMEKAVEKIGKKGK